MRLLKISPLLLGLCLSALLPLNASARTRKVSGTVQSVKPRQGLLLVRSAARTWRVSVAPTARLAGADRSRNGVLGLEDVQRGDRVSVSGQRRGRTLQATSLENQSTSLAGDDDGDGLPDDAAAVSAQGKVTTVNPDQRVLQMRVSRSEQANLVDQELLVTVPEGALLVVGDANRDRVRDWRDVQVGDRLLALLVDPVDLQTGGQALVVVDRDSLRAGRPPAPPRPPRPQRLPMGGTLTAVDAAGGTLTLQPPLLLLAPVQLGVDPAAELEVPDSNADGKRDLADLQVGDWVLVLVDVSDPAKPLVIKLRAHHEDDQPEPGHEEGGSGDTPPPPPPPAGPFLLGGPLQSINPDERALQLQVVVGPLTGQTVSLRADSHTVVLSPDRNTDGKIDLADLLAGDRLAVMVQHKEDRLEVLSITNLGPSLPPPPPPPV